MMKKLQWILYPIFSLLIPIAWIIYKFKLFSKANVTTVSVWALIVIIIFVSIVALFIKYYLDGMKTKFSYLKQILTGIVKVVLPLGILLVVIIFTKTKLDWLKENINLLITTFSIIFASETIAIFINPLPKWAFDNNVEGIVDIAGKIKKGK